MQGCGSGGMRVWEDAGIEGCGDAFGPRGSGRGPRCSSAPCWQSSALYREAAAAARLRAGDISQTVLNEALKGSRLARGCAKAEALLLAGF